MQKKNFENALKFTKEIVNLTINDHLNNKDIKYITKRISFFYKKKISLINLEFSRLIENKQGLKIADI